MTEITSQTLHQKVGKKGAVKTRRRTRRYKEVMFEKHCNQRY